MKDLLLLAVTLLLPFHLAATDLVVLSSQALSSVMEELTPEFERASGQHVIIRYGVSNALATEIESGSAFDATILTAALIDGLIGKGEIEAGSRRDIARSGIGIAMKTGAIKPDLSDEAAFKRSMIAAPLGVAYTSVGASGVYFQKLLQKLDMSEALQGKLHVQTSGRAAEQVARGEATYAFQQISELIGVPGTVVAGPLPPDLQLYTQFSVAVGAKAANPIGARALAAFLTEKRHAPLLASKGLDAN